MGSIRGGTEAPPMWLMYLEKVCPLPYVGWGVFGKCPMGGWQ